MSVSPLLKDERALAPVTEPAPMPLDRLLELSRLQLANMCQREKESLFHPIASKLRDAAKWMAESPLSGDIDEDMRRFGVVRDAIERTLGPFQAPEPVQNGGIPNSLQLRFLIGANVGLPAIAAESPSGEKSVQGREVQESQ